MSKEKAPAFQFYAADYLADINVQLMTMEEEGCYCRLMAYCWREGSLPADPDTLASLCKGTVPSDRIMSCFTIRDGRLVHKRLEEEREKHAEWRKKCAKGGRRSARKPKTLKAQSAEQGSSTTVSRVVEVNEQGSSTLHLQSSSSTSSSKINNKPPSEVTLLKQFIESEYLNARSIPLVSDKSDWIAIANLLKSLKGKAPTEQIKKAWTIFLRSTDEFHRKQGHPLRYWATNINPFLSEAQAEENKQQLGALVSGLFK
jgi:uncharacterized protein YdaU (DUF1376 family)